MASRVASIGNVPENFMRYADTSNLTRVSTNLAFQSINKGCFRVFYQQLAMLNRYHNKIKTLF